MLGESLARFYLSVLRTFGAAIIRVFSKIPTLSKNPYYLWELGRFKRHPRHYRGFLGFLLEIRTGWAFLLFVMFHFLIALMFAATLDLEHSSLWGQGNIKADFNERLYFSLINQLTLGFTEYLPTTGASQILLLLQSYIGLLLNALILAIIVSRVFQPKDVFEVAPIMAHDTQAGQLVFRIYSKYPEAVYNLNAELHRFSIGEAGQPSVIGVTTVISTTPANRRILLKNYALLIKVSIDYSEKKYEGKLHSKRIPWSWLGEHQTRSELLLVLSAETSTGTVHQFQRFSSISFICGRHRLLNEGIDLDLESWYDFRNYRWSTWGKISVGHDACQAKHCGCVSYETNN